VNLYIADTVRCENPNTFTSNMLYSLSILYKSKLPMLVCFNKNDVLDHSFAIEWMKDFDILDKHLSKVDTYLSSLSRSLSLVLEEFYKNVEACGVSAKTGKGFEFMINDKIPKCKEETRRCNVSTRGGHEVMLINRFNKYVVHSIICVTFL
jgi:GPN-loop GTPase